MNFIAQNYDALLWLLLFVVFLIAEAASSALISLWFAAGAIVSMFIAFLGLPGWVQVLVFLAVSGIVLLVAKPWIEKSVNQKTVKTNADRVLGALGTVTEDIDNLSALGRVSVLGQSWSARAEDDSVIGQGEKVRIVKIDGVKLIVKKEEREETTC